MNGPRGASPGGVGVLLVHGMGSAAQGDTLRNVGGPLYDVLGRGPAADAGLVIGPLESAKLQGGDDQPAHVTFGVHPQGRPQDAATWWMAECHWGESFRPPRYKSLLAWLVLALPWTLIGYFRTKRVHARQRRARRGKEVPVRDKVLGVAWLGASLVLGPLLAAVLVLVLVLAIPLSRFPVKPVKAAASAVIRVLSASLGDVYMLASTSFDRRAVEERLERDLTFLLEHCDRVAIVAHSAGSYLTHSLLRQAEVTRWPEPHRVPLLITYGQAVWRVRAVNKLREGGAGRRKAVVLSTTALLTGAAACWVAVSREVSRQAWPGWLAPLFAVVMVVACYWAYRLVGRAAAIAEDQDALGLAEGRRWRDYVASTDPVPNGVMPMKLALRCGGPARSYEGVRMHNRRSVITDHNTYARNEDVFLAGVARDLLWLSGHGQGDAEQRARARDAWIDRRGRTRWVSTARATYALCAGWLLVVAAWSAGSTADDSSRAMQWGAWLVGRLPDSWTSTLFGISPAGGVSARAKLVGIVAIALAVVLGYLLLRTAWNAWNRAAEKAVLYRDETAAAAGKRTAVASRKRTAAAERARDARRKRTVFRLAWSALLLVLVGLAFWCQFRVPGELSMRAWEGQRLPGGWFAALAAVAVAVSVVALWYTTGPGSSDRDLVGATDWDPAMGRDVPVPQAPVQVPAVTPSDAVGTGPASNGHSPTALKQCWLCRASRVP